MFARIAIGVGGAYLAMVLTGCATSPTNVVECGSTIKAPPGTGPAILGKEYGVQMSPIPADSVLFATKGLAKHVAIQGLFASRTETDTVQVTARFVNCSDQVVKLGVRVHFMDSKQRPTEKPTVWQAVFIQPRSMGVYTESSLGAENVGSYLVELRDGNG